MRLTNESRPGPRSRRAARRAAWPALILALCACEDAGTDPTALLTLEDAHPAIMLAAELPSLPGLAGAGRLEPELTGAIALWVESWALPVEEGEERRVAAYEQAVETLAAGLGPAAVRDGLDRVDAALQMAEGLGRIGLPGAVAARVVAAGQEAAAAREALDAGVLPLAVRATLHAADILRGVGPEGVARTLIGRAEGGLRWAGSPADPIALQRAQHLLAGAREAAADAHFGLAIQRAYYACQLLGVAFP